MRFHRRCGDRVTLLNDNSAAVRNFVEFNHGLIFSAEPLQDDVTFEVCIDRKVNVWNGSLEIGVTTLDPEVMEVPATATKLRNTAWIMSGSSIVKDGVTLINSYGPELDTLREGDCIGVVRSNKGELLFCVNGRCLGVAARDVPSQLFAVIDLYGQCVQVTIMNTAAIRPNMDGSLDQIEDDPNNDDTLTSSEMEGAAAAPHQPITNAGNAIEVYVPITTEGACAMVAQDRLRFHPRCGILVKLTSNNKTAERARPLDDYNNGVVMTHRPLYDNELFEIRIDRLVDKWSGSIEVGVTTHNPATIRFPSTMTNMDTGTIMMSGCKVLVNGQGTCMEYGNFNLDELREGDAVGMMRKGDGKLHYYINGVDQGVATDKVESQVWGVIDLYGMTVKVSIIDSCDDADSNIPNVPALESSVDSPAPGCFRQRIERIDEESLLFHTLRDSNVIIINDGKTAHRPNAFEHFNNGVVMTNRTLKTNELFQVRLDLVIPKWAGSIEIGVTQHSCNEIEFPFKMSNAKSGTWAMTGEDVIRDGTIIIPQYVRNLNRLVEGDTVGVMRKDMGNMGILHFFVNGVDQGPAAFNIPEHVFGVVDLYGRVAQATIVDCYLPPPSYSPESPLSTESNGTVYPEMCFHRVHGRNARLSRNRLTASRATVYSEFNDAVLFSSRPLRECEMFEIRIDKMVDCWIGSLEIGVTAIKPEELEARGGVGAVAGTATDLNWDTYILSGAAMMKDGECVRSGYPLDLDSLTIGSRVGLMWHADRSLHYYLDGMDQGKAWYVPHLNIYAIVDLYGQCTQVTILQNEERQFNYNGLTYSDNSLSYRRNLNALPPPYCFSEYCSDNAVLIHDYAYARRMTSDPTSSLVFSSGILVVGEMFEIKIAECTEKYAGGLRMGVTDINVLNAHVNRNFPPAIQHLPHYTVYINGSTLHCSRPGSREQDLFSVSPGLDWLRPGDRVGLKKTSDAKVHIYYNSEPLNVTFENVPDKVYVVMELYGGVYKIQAISKVLSTGTSLPQPTVIGECSKAPVSTVTVTSTVTTAVATTAVATTAVATCSGTGPAQASATNGPAERRRRSPLPYTFHYIHGNNIKLTSSDTVAMRTSGYKDAVAVVSQPLRRGHTFRFRVDKLSGAWSGSVTIGAVGSLPTESVPPTALAIEPPVWLASSELLSDNGSYAAPSLLQTNSQLAASLDELGEQSVICIHFRFNSELVLDLDGKTVGVIAVVPRSYPHVYPLIDLYGRVCQVSVLLHPHVVVSGASVDLPIITENPTEDLLEEEQDLLPDAEIELELDVEPPAEEPEPRLIRTVKAHSEEIVMEDHTEQPSTSIPLPIEPTPLPPEPKAKDITNKKLCANKLALHQSFILGDQVPIDNNDDVNRCIQKSHSTHSFLYYGDGRNLDPEIAERLNQTLIVDAQDVDDEQFVVPERFCDTNIQHNDRYPEREASDVDNLDNEIMSGLTLDATNLPDLTEEQSSSIDESTRRDDLDSESLCSENLRYLNRLINLSQAAEEAESEWQASGEGCEHLHLVLKFWSYLVMPYPDLRRAVTNWGRVLCYCNNCKPDAEPQYAGWVCIERTAATDETRRRFWHVDRSTVAFAQAGLVDTGDVTRPALSPRQHTAGTPSDIWFDEEGKPHHTVLALEIETEPQAEMDRLVSFLIYLRPHLAFGDAPSID